MIAALYLIICTPIRIPITPSAPNTVNFPYNDTRRGIKKVFLFAKCCYNSTRSLIICITMGWHFALGIGNSVVIRELSLYPQSLLAKLTVCTLDRLTPRISIVDIGYVSKTNPKDNTFAQ